MTPLFVDNVNVNLFVAITEPGNASDPGHVEVWTNAGFGRVDPFSVNPTNSGLADATLTMWQDADSGSYWLTPNTKYQTDDIAQLQTDSWRLMNFLISRAYEMPDIPLPLTWAKVTQTLYVGLSVDTLAVCVTRTDLTWEWTLRGPSGNDTWTIAPTLAEAKAAAANAMTN